jgi:hypothetical protein
MNLRDILKGDGRVVTDAEKIEVMCTTRGVRDTALRFIQEVEAEFVKVKRKAKKTYNSGEELTQWEIKRLNILRAIIKDFSPLKNKMIEKGGHQP